MSDPRRLISLSAVGNRGEVRRVGFDEEPVVGYEAQQVIVSPLLESDDAAEGDVPPRPERGLSERVRSGITMKHAADSRGAGFHDHRPRVILGVTGVDDERTSKLPSKRYLRAERAHLRIAWRVFVMVVEAALADGDCAAADHFLNAGNVTLCIEIRGIVRMHAGGKKDETGVATRDSRRSGGRVKRLADADDSLRARFAGASGYRVAVAVEGRVREVGVAVDEDDLPSVRRGHFRSIHSRTGAAT